MAEVVAARMIDAVIFDWGGTLTPWKTMVPLDIWRSYADALHPDDPATAGEVAAAILAAEDARWDTARTKHLAFTVAHVLEDAGVSSSAAALTAYRAAIEFATFTDPAAEAMLRRLKSWGLRVGVLSSTTWPADWHEEFLRRDGILDLFDGVVWSSDLDYTKPHADAFRAAVAAVGAEDPTRCVYVGDRPYDDVHGAQAIGMRAVLIPNSDIPKIQQVPVDVTPDAVVTSLADLPAVIDGWR
jgi:HAD superfamily hydrolase (TIGR01509 family)